MDILDETLDYLSIKTDGFKPENAVILGSGLGCFCDDLKGTTVRYEEIPNFACSGVQGHKGELLFCEINSRPTVVMQGRFHYYEGNSMAVCTYPIKVFKKMGVNNLFITNAAGASHKKLKPSDIVLITDHINFMGNNPLIGKNDDTQGDRFPDMSNCYTKKMQVLAQNCAKELKIPIKQGVYLATTGPCYETKAEVRAYRTLGADVIGMSSVPEAIMANYLKMNTVAFSMVTNYATGVSDKKLSHKEVIEIGEKSGQKLANLIKKMIEKI